MCIKQLVILRIYANQTACQRVSQARGQAQASQFPQKLPRIFEQTHSHCLQINYFVGEFQEGFWNAQHCVC